MRSVSYRLADFENKKLVIPIGFVGENEFTKVNIDCQRVFKDHPSAVATLSVVPPSGDDYPAIVTRDGDIVTWEVTASDLVYDGFGEIQLTFTDGTKIGKDYKARTHIEDSIAGSGTAPTPVQNWIDSANEKLAAVEEATQEAEDAASHPPRVGSTGYWETWNAETEQYVATSTKAKGEDGDPGHSPVITANKNGKTTVLYSDGQQIAQIVDGNDGNPGDPTTLIDDTAGTGVTNKTLSADKITTEFGSVLSDIQGLDDDKYEKPSGGIPSTDMSQAVQTSLGKADSAYQKPQTGIPASDMAEGVIPTVPAIATSAQIKTGTDSTHPIAPNRQNESVFYGLAKLAGADMDQSANPVGQFTDSAKTAIQKMLGIYEAPWELIREDTVTNATDANIEITVDGNGNSFELTDVRLMFCSPVQETQFVKGDYGKIKFGYGTGSDADSCFIGAYTQAANASRKISYCEIEQKNGMIKKQYTQNATNGGNANIQTYVNDLEQSYFIEPNSVRYYNKVIITNVTGTAKYKLYGKRKWN